jgi:lipid-A-disaccharide synthase
LGLQPDDRVVGLFPGSRKQEIKRHLPVLIETAKLLRKFHPDLQFILAEVPQVPEALYEKYLHDVIGITRVRGQSHAVMQHANASFVKSGSSTIEAAYFGNPFVVFYKTSRISFAIGKRVVKVPYIAMANILAGKEVVKELIQDDATPENLMAAILPLLTVSDRIAQARAGLKFVREQLGEPGAGKSVAEMTRELILSS